MKRLLFTFLMTMSVVVNIAAQDMFSSKIVADEGAWCWFADPRALHFENDTGTINAQLLACGGQHVGY